MTNTELVLFAMLQAETAKRVALEWEIGLLKQKEKSAKIVDAYFERNRQPDGSVVIQWMI